jgi:putative tricarboxylic transport membrane protein
VSVEDRPDAASGPARLLLRKDVLAGLMFIAVAVLGLYLARDYTVGTAVRMGTGYIPRLLCWVLAALGAATVLQGLLPGGETVASEKGARWRAAVFVPGALVVFALTVEPLGLFIASLALVVVGSLAGRDLRLVEVAVAALVLAALCVGIFVWGLRLPIAIWPEW